MLKMIKTRRKKKKDKKNKIKIYCIIINNILFFIINRINIYTLYIAIYD